MQEFSKTKHHMYKNDRDMQGPAWKMKLYVCHGPMRLDGKDLSTCLVLAIAHLLMLQIFGASKTVWR